MLQPSDIRSVGKELIVLFELSTWLASFPYFFIHLRHYSVIWKQLLFANYRNRVHWVVLGLSQDGACTDLFENFSENSLKGDLSNDTTLNQPLFSLVNTFKDRPLKWPCESTGPIFCSLFTITYLRMWKACHSIRLSKHAWGAIFGTKHIYLHVRKIKPKKFDCFSWYFGWF